MMGYFITWMVGFLTAFIAILVIRSEDLAYTLYGWIGSTIIIAGFSLSYFAFGRLARLQNDITP